MGNKPSPSPEEQAEQLSAFWQKYLGDTTALLDGFLSKAQPDLKRMFDPFNLGPVLTEFTKNLTEDPAVFWRQQQRFAQAYLALVQQQLASFQGEEVAPVIEPQKGDKRFKGDAWQTPGPFDFMKQTYLLASESIQATIAETEGLNPKDHQKLKFFAKQYIDALSPTNFLLTNPEALTKTLEEGGQNLRRGAEFIAEDLKRGKGVPLVKMVDDSQFSVGENIAVTPGDVVFRNRIFELIQYKPQTPEVHEIPLVIFPPWINKFYILDLSDKKSFVRWALQQGYQVFIVSWVNPDGALRDADFDTYLTEGYLEAFKAAREITGAKSLNLIGYCVAGTFLSAVLAYLEAKGRADEIESATFFTAQVDFEECGDLGLFVDDDQLAHIDHLAAEKGYLDKRYMALTFNMLRSNDLIWSYVVNNYLLGQEPMAFDLLFWNCDSTNLPYRLHVDYLTSMYRDNKLVQPGGITLGGVPIDLTTIKTPLYLQAGREDHIAPAKSVFKLTKIAQGDITYMLAGSGHIAGVVNPPAAEKYQYWVGDSKAPTYEAFIDGATEIKGSWWPHWSDWLKERSGALKKAPETGSKTHPALCAAPGTYVKVLGD